MKNKNILSTTRYVNQQRTAPYVFMLPFVLLFFLFALFPIVFSMVLAVHRWNGMSKMTFVGLKNITFLLKDDPYFWRSIFMTLRLMVFGSLTQHLFAIPLAIVLNNKLVKGREFFKSAFFFPYITSAVSIAIIFGYIFSTNYGPVNFVLKLFGMTKPIEWIQDKNYLPVALSVIINWRYIGWNTIIYLAGLQSISPELYEAADLDGATPFKKHLHITVPLLMPIIFFGVSLSIIGGMQLFDEPFVFTRGFESMGGAGQAGFTSAFYILWLLQRAARLGRGSAASWLLFIFILALTLINRVVTNRLEGKDKGER